ncbi:hypothetical protein [Amycolatopsis sp. FU40]|uniref:hypothetical protein n=1 Tax=Amycolatopsis sp. FU40 TaxID=2914159 RepID=UPI001F2B08B1|nr:hypothetical protein [Amycolatopsis sp. FU40]
MKVSVTFARAAPICALGAEGDEMELQLVVLTLAVVLLLIAGTVFAAWRSERVDRDDEPPSREG